MSESSKVFFGGTGKLGSEFSVHNTEYIYPDHSEVDLTDTKLVYEYIGDLRPDLVIQAGALVGKKECDENKKRAYETNVLGTENVALACRDFNTRLVYISSASIFRGDIGNYDEYAIPDPQYYYALTKLLGEQATRVLPNYLIVRTDFFVPEGFKYKTVYIDHYCSKIPVDILASYLKLVAESDLQGVINIGHERDTLFNILSPYIEGIVGITIENSSMPNFPRDLSLRTDKLSDFLRARGIII